MGILSGILKLLYGELLERAKKKEEKEAKKRQCLADEFTKVLQTCKEKAKEKERKREEKKVVDFGEGGPVRCSRWKGFTDETPRDYHCNLDPDGRRRDDDERPELCRGTVEFVATKEYMVREPMEAVYFVLIDVSMNAIQTGATAAACSSINQVIGDLLVGLSACDNAFLNFQSIILFVEGPQTMVGIATFDSTIHFYNLKPALQQVKCII
ncbi:hypothetical protein K2173_015233 [Erythroxylum novogranatense]|uniref:Sec23/Sec24 trunk domain-containing protein n=1 Tax=Erythroxylum novogranatense TaxID=1862640 RepID=A0AAV8T1C4_9ROSI|nr:hypothetical protein K2173_015233 [Erythroxylum novogranatense]